ncbi:MAG: lamin tail domain-containing protein [Actinomycetota bacterium]
MSATVGHRRAAWCLSALGVALGACSAEPGTEPAPEPGDATVVVEVVDGDTLDVRLPDGSTDRVRVLGVNAPEDGECFSTEAAAELERLALGEEVVLVVDETDRDQYDRLLRYVELAGDDVGAALVTGGFAVVRVSEPDVARAADLRDREEEARGAQRGLWSPSACGPPSGQAGRLAIVGLRLDADGDDAKNLNDEWVEVQNTGASAVLLTGWVVRDESSSHRFSFPDGFTLAPGATVRIRSGCGTASDSELFWCTSGSAIWNNGGDTAFLLDPAGNIVDRVAR